MTAEAFFWILLSWLLGYALCTWSLPGSDKRRLRLALAPGLGMGLSSLLEFLGLSLGWESLAPISELFLVVVISMLLVRSKGGRSRLEGTASSGPRCHRSLPLAVGILAAMAFTSFVLQSILAPHGQSDAMNIWNLHARFLFRSPEHWQDVFAPTLDYSHPDYPLLLPGFIARTWSRLGTDTTLVPILVALGFAASLVALLLEALRDRGLVRAGWLSAFVLLASPSLTTLASGQLADVPLAFFYLASLVLLTQDRTSGSSLALAGFCAGLAAWTKNEGQLFLLLFAGGSLLWLRRQRPERSGRSLLALLLGALPALIALAWFKLVLAPSNDLVGTAESAGIVAKLLDPSRYADVGLGIAQGLLQVGDGFLLWVLALLVFLPRQPPAQTRTTRRLVLALALSTLLGYAMVYIALSGDVTEHMATSLPRLLLQLWPLTLFGLLTLDPVLVPKLQQDTRP